MREIDERFFVNENKGKKNKVKIEDVLLPGEKILWRGKPKKLSYVLYKCIKLIPIAIIWGAIDFGVLFTIFKDGAGQGIVFFLVPFFAIHLLPVWLCIGSIVKA